MTPPIKAIDDVYLMASRGVLVKSEPDAADSPNTSESPGITNVATVDASSSLKGGDTKRGDMKLAKVVGLQSRGEAAQKPRVTFPRANPHVFALPKSINPGLFALPKNSMNLRLPGSPLPLSVANPSGSTAIPQQSTHNGGAVAKGHLIAKDASLDKLASEKFGRNERACLLYTSPSPRDLSTSRMPSSA